MQINERNGPRHALPPEPTLGTSMLRWILRELHFPLRKASVLRNSPGTSCWCRSSSFTGWGIFVWRFGDYCLKRQRPGTNGCGADVKRDLLPEQAAIDVRGHWQDGLEGVYFSGLAAGFVRLWQINLTIPPGTPAGSAVPMRVVVNGTTSNTVTVAVR
jgi:hypothetical protein